MAILVLAKFGFNHWRFSMQQLSNIADVLAPGKIVSDPLNAMSLGMSLMFGTAGLPHIPMRFYTVPDAKTARNRSPTLSLASFTCSPHPRLRGDGVWVKTISRELTQATWQRC